MARFLFHIRHAGLKIVAIVIAILLWFFIAGNRP
jgi:hypothetical protein